MKKLFICILTIIFHGLYFPISGKNEIDNTIKINLSGKIYKQFSFLITEEIRSDMDFSSTNWLFSTAEFNYKIKPWIKTGVAYVHILNTHHSEQNKNRYVLYATAEHRTKQFIFSFRERFQGTYSKNSSKPNNCLRARFLIKYKINKTSLTPYIFVETFNNTYHVQMKLNKIRFSAGCNYLLKSRNKMELFYRYHIFYKTDNINYKNNIGLSYTYSF